jgi:uncharacterized damage-inducible protein DinB
VLHDGLPALWRAQQTIDQWYIDWSDRQSARSLDEIVRFRFVDGERGAMTRGEILLHVVNHATYHRGWVADMFFQVPARNPTTDLPVYLSNQNRARPPSHAEPKTAHQPSRPRSPTATRMPSQGSLMPVWCRA